MQILYLLILGLVTAVCPTVSTALQGRDLTTNVLLPRQDSTDCDPRCVAFMMAFQECPDFQTSCFCTSAIAADLQECVNCASASGDPTLLDDPTTFSNAFDITCAGQGVVLVTFPVTQSPILSTTGGIGVPGFDPTIVPSIAITESPMKTHISSSAVQSSATIAPGGSVGVSGAQPRIDLVMIRTTGTGIVGAIVAFVFL